MKNSVVVLSTLVLAQAASVQAATIRDNRTETIQSKAVGYLVEYPDGTREKYLVSYQATLGIYREQEGEASKTEITWHGPVPEIRVHAIDDRECRWRFRSSITRRIAMVNHAGQQFPKAKLSHVFEISQSGRGEGANWTRWHAQSCNQAQNNFDNELTGARNKLSRIFPQITNKDGDVVKKELRKELTNVKAITVAQ